MSAFDELVVKYQDRIYNVAYRMTGHAEDARDVAQEAFLKAFRNLDSFLGSARFYTWLYRITVNAAISRRRHSAVRPRTVRLGDGSGDRGALPPPDPAQEDPADAANRADVTALVEEAIAGLDAEHRAVVALRDIEGRSYDEIAEILDCPRGTVKSRLHRARNLLREALSEVLIAEER